MRNAHSGPDGEIRTPVLEIPNFAVYAAGLHPDIKQDTFTNTSNNDAHERN